jgi:N-acetylglucosaminyldiphosphoundecaprenol N-acetyl-beta-D-mannosaminyltransferase
MASFTDDRASADLAVRPYRAPQRRSEFVNGVRLDPVSPPELAERIAEYLARGSSHVVHFCAAHPTVLARRDAEYRALLNRGDLNVPDGMAVAWAVRLLTGGHVERVAGSDAMTYLCEWGVGRSLRHYLFGGTPEVVSLLVRRLEQRFPGIEIVGAESPPFRPLAEDEWVDAAARMRAAGADLVWVGLGAPKQDPAGERSKVHGASPVILCVGAAFDFLSGKKRRAPVWLQRIGLEWVHRLASDPHRLWRRYVLGNPEFAAGVLRDYLRQRR